MEEKTSILKNKRAVIAIVAVVCLIIIIIVFNIFNSPENKLKRAINTNGSIAASVNNSISKQDWNSLSDENRKEVIKALFSRDITQESTWEDIEKIGKWYSISDSDYKYGLEVAGFQNASLNDFSVKRQSGSYLVQGEKAVVNNDGSVDKVKTEELKEKKDIVYYRGCDVGISSSKIDDKDVSGYYVYETDDGFIFADCNRLDAAFYDLNKKVATEYYDF